MMRVGWLRSLEHAWPVSVGGSHDDDYGSKLGIGGSRITTELEGR